METTHDQPVPCPRCGYDLRGEVATWRKVCPMNGRCSECGLEFEWEKVFREAKHPWLFEHHWRRRPFSSALRTLWTLLRPWRFWREVDLSDPVFPWPPLFLFLSLPLVAAGIRVIVAQIDLWQTPRRFNLDAMIDAVHRVLKGTDWWTPGPPAIFRALQFTLLSLVVYITMSRVAFFLLPVSLRRAKVLPIHVSRIAVYSVGWVALILLASECVGMLAGGFNLLVSYRQKIDLPEISTVQTNVLIFTIALVFFWGHAARHYLRLPNAWAVALAMNLIAGVASLLIFVIVALVTNNYQWLFNI